MNTAIKDEWNPVLHLMQKKAYYDDFFICFLPWHNKGMGPDSKDGETALFHRPTQKYYILNGDWMLAYAELAPRGFEACFELFKLKAPQFMSTWSNYPPEESQ